MSSLIFSVSTLTANITLTFPLTNNFFIVNSQGQTTITLPTLTNTNYVGQIIYFKNICNQTATIKVPDGSGNIIYSSSYNDYNNPNDNSAEKTSYLLRRTILSVFYCIGSNEWCISS